MVSLEQDKTIEEHLAEVANTIGNAVLVLDASIDGDTFVAVVGELDQIGYQDKLSLVLNSTGGSIEEAFRIAKAIRGNAGNSRSLSPALQKARLP